MKYMLATERADVNLYITETIFICSLQPSLILRENYQTLASYFTLLLLHFAINSTPSTYLHFTFNSTNLYVYMSYVLGCTALFTVYII